VAEDAFELALKALGRKERTSAELSQWLLERGVEADDAAAVVGRLVEDGVIDDARFAARFAEDKRELAGWGAERIREALEARGVVAADVEAALAADSEPMQLQRAQALLARRERGLETEADRASALGYLTRRGYTYEVAHDAIRAASGRRAA
jgi:regulatory protein